MRNYQMILQSHLGTQTSVSIQICTRTSVCQDTSVSVTVSINETPWHQNPRMLKSHIWFSVSMVSICGFNEPWVGTRVYSWLNLQGKTHKCRRLCIYWKSPCQSSNPSCSKVSDISKVNEITVSKRCRFYTPKAIGKAWENLCPSI